MGIKAAMWTKEEVSKPNLRPDKKLEPEDCVVLSLANNFNKP